MAALAVHTIGHGTPARCTPAAVVAAVAVGGRIDFDCGSAPLTITLQRTAKVVNTSPRVVIDGGNRITLSGGGRRRILYADTCDPHRRTPPYAHRIATALSPIESRICCHGLPAD